MNSYNLDQTTYNQIVNSLNNNATVTINIGIVFDDFVTVSGVENGEWIYELTAGGELQRWEAKFDFADMVLKRICKEGTQSDRTAELETENAQRAWFETHPSA